MKTNVIIPAQIIVAITETKGAMKEVFANNQTNHANNKFT